MMDSFDNKINTMLRVYVIILNYKKWEDVTECLQTLFRSGYTHFTAIVVDNDSKNGSIDQLISWAGKNLASGNPAGSFTKNEIQKPLEYRYFCSNDFNSDIDPEQFPPLVFVQNNKNAGFAGGINIILQHLLQEDAYIWLLNPDMTVEASTLSELVSFAGSCARNSIIGSVIKYYDDPEKIHLYAGGRVNFNFATVQMVKSKEKISTLDYISGGSLFTHAANFIEMGLLPEDYFLYWEETDFCYRAKKGGYSLLLCETAVCYDKISTSIGKNFLSDYYYTRNGLYFLSRYKNKKVPVAFFFMIFRLLKRILSGKFNRARGMYEGMLSFLNREKYAYK